MTVSSVPEWLTSLQDSSSSGADTKALRQKWTEYVKDDPKSRHRYLSTARGLAARNYAPVHLRRLQRPDPFPEVSKREPKFLRSKEAQQRSRDNLSTPKFFTALGGRAAKGAARPPADPSVPIVSKTGRVELKSANYNALTSGRIQLPKYLVVDADGECTGRPNPMSESQEYHSQDIDSTSQEATSTDASACKQSVHAWYDLIKRPVPQRPKFSMPIHCKTPRILTGVKPSYLRPTAGMFYAAGGPQPKQNFIVDPQFLSESTHIENIAEMASNPLKFGWG